MTKPLRLGAGNRIDSHGVEKDSEGAIEFYFGGSIGRIEFNGADWDLYVDGSLTGSIPGSGGATTFLGLTDTPSTYSLAAGFYVRVNSTPNGLEFRSPAGVLSDIGGVPTSRTLTAGTGLAGGGDLTANRTFSIADTGITPDTYGDGLSQTFVLVVNGQGQITGIATANIELDASAILSGQFATGMIQDNAITNAKLRDSSALSVIGRSANSTGDPADIAAASDHQVLRRSGTTLGFGAVNLAQANAITGALPIGNGGTNATTAANARTNLGLGTAATQNTGTSGAVVPLLNGANTHSGLSTFTGGNFINGGARVKVADYTAGGTLTVSDYYAVVAGSSGITLPASPANGQTFVLREFVGANCTVNRNGNTINGVAANYTLAANGTVRLIYDAIVIGGWMTFAG